MTEQVLHKCDFIEVTSDGQNYFIESFRKGFTLEQFNKVISNHPQIRITSFTTIKSALIFAPRPKEKFGEKKERISLIISPDFMKAFIKLGLDTSELEYSNRKKLQKEILNKLAENGIVYGIKNDLLLGNIENDKEILIAEGKQPEHGIDSVIRMYEIEEVKPVVLQDGSVDHYELSLINRVKKDEWLGERIDATAGISGINIKGEEVKAIPGRNKLLEYDRNSVYEVREENKTTLYSMYNGAVSYKDGKINVSNHLEIDGNVDFTTGNIDFDGCVTIKGTIVDNFLVTANGDIEVLGELGIGNIRGLQSRNGSIYIKGGISAKNKVSVNAAKNVFTKFIANASITAGNLVHVGYYCINSDIYAKEVVVDSSQGKIIGGMIVADARVQANAIGSESEKRTLINVKGINKELIKERLEEIYKLLVDKRNEQFALKNELSNKGEADSRKRAEIKERLRLIIDEIKETEQEKKTLTNYLKIHGDGEIVVLRKVYPNCFIEISNACKEITETRNGVTFYAENGEIKEI